MFYMLFGCLTFYKVLFTVMYRTSPFHIGTKRKGDNEQAQFLSQGYQKGGRKQKKSIFFFRQQKNLGLDVFCKRKAKTRAKELCFIFKIGKSEVSFGCWRLPLLPVLQSMITIPELIFCILHSMGYQSSVEKSIVERSIT